eukprot:2584874-Pleurochrysis_carterae.AAC.1
MWGIVERMGSVVLLCGGRWVGCCMREAGGVVLRREVMLAGDTWQGLAWVPRGYCVWRGGRERDNVSEPDLYRSVEREWKGRLVTLGWEC